jgi:hypothetical protein
VLGTLSCHPAHFTGGQAVTDGLGELLRQDLRDSFLHPLRYDPLPEAAAAAGPQCASGLEGTLEELESLLDVSKCHLAAAPAKRARDEE